MHGVILEGKKKQKKGSQQDIERLYCLHFKTLYSQLDLERKR